MLLMNTATWIVFGVAVVILALFIGKKIKDRYFQKGGSFHWILDCTHIQEGKLIKHCKEFLSIAAGELFVMRKPYK